MRRIARDFCIVWITVMLIMSFGFWLVSTCNAATLQWDPYEQSTDPNSQAIGFVIYSQVKGLTATPWAVTLTDINATTYQIDPLQYPYVENDVGEPTVYEFWITAYNNQMESDASNTAEYTPARFVPPDNPKDVVIKISGAQNVQVNVE